MAGEDIGISGRCNHEEIRRYRPGLQRPVAWLSSQALAEECFTAVKKLSEDEQNIRIKPLDTGWEVGKNASLTPASLIGGKAGLYPDDDVESCLNEEEG
jgi:hypothetical protein